MTTIGTYVHNNRRVIWADRRFVNDALITDEDGSRIQKIYDFGSCIIAFSWAYSTIKMIVERLPEWNACESWYIMDTIKDFCKDNAMFKERKTLETTHILVATEDWNAYTFSDDFVWIPNTTYSTLYFVESILRAWILTTDTTRYMKWLFEKLRENFDNCGRYIDFFIQKEDKTWFDKVSFIAREEILSLE